MTFQAKSSINYSRDGLTIQLEAGAYYDLKSEDYTSLPDSVKDHLVPLETVEVKKVVPVKVEAEVETAPVKKAPKSKSRKGKE
jgi:hypothetical protein